MLIKQLEKSSSQSMKNEVQTICKKCEKNFCHCYLVSITDHHDQ